jgi:hypothetical protein
MKSQKVAIGAAGFDDHDSQEATSVGNGEGKKTGMP